MQSLFSPYDSNAARKARRRILKKSDFFLCKINNLLQQIRHNTKHPARRFTTNAGSNCSKDLNLWPLTAASAAAVIVSLHPNEIITL